MFSVLSLGEDGMCMCVRILRRPKYAVAATQEIAVVVVIDLIGIDPSGVLDWLVLMRVAFQIIRWKPLKQCSLMGYLRLNRLE